MKTKAVIFPEANKFETREIELEKPRPQDVVIRTLVTAISPGTERWTLRGKHLGTEFPCIPGYHRIGIIEECGKEVMNLQCGDIVYGSSANRLKNKKIISMFGAHVGLSVGAQKYYRFISSTLPGRLELETTVFTMLVGVANRGIRFCNIKCGQHILIIGAGIIGICAAQLAIMQGGLPVLLEIDEERVDFVKQIIPNIIRPNDEKFEIKLKELAPDGFDILYDTVGHAPTTNKIVQYMRRQGTILLQAQYFDREKCALDLDQIKIRELVMKTTCGIDDQDWFDTFTNIRTRRLKIAPLITHRFDSKDILKGYELLHTGKPFNLGIVFHWDKK